jgi:exopolysaccharide biosynthesis polyprenyl glycosylphosphotransferase
MNKHVSVEQLRDLAIVHREAPSNAMLRFSLALSFVGVDVIALIVGFLGAGILRFGWTWPDNVELILGAFLPVYLVSAGMMRAYSGAVILDRRQAVLRAVTALAVAVGVISLVMFFVKASELFSRAHFGFALLFAGVLLVGLRLLLVEHSRWRLGGTLFSVVELRDGLPQRRGSPAASFDTAPCFDPMNPDADSFDQLAKLIGKADRVVVRCDIERRSAWAHVLQGMNVEAEIVCPEIGDIMPLALGEHMGETTLVVARGPLGQRDRLLKRLFDVAFAGGALIVLSPVMLLTALAIKLESPGPVFFVQPRIGRQNRLFRLIKFRSMRTDQCDVNASALTQKGDSRVTRVGNFIRRTSIDEIPQFINVLLGDMSVVGPRPHAIHAKAFDRLYWDVDARYWCRHACRPGLTGLAQIKGFRGSTDTYSDLTRRVDADLEYLNRWSFWNDLRIILQTLKVLVHQNAY